MSAQKAIAWLTGILTLALALFSFILSFNALTDLASQHGMAIPPLFPLVVEFAVIIFSLNALYRSLYGESATAQWALIIGSSLLAGIFNVAHAQDEAISRLMAAMPSLFLLLSFEAFLGQVKHMVKRSRIIQSIEQLEADLNQMRSTLRQQFDQERSTLATHLEQLDLELTTKRSELEQLTQQIKDLGLHKVELEQAIAELQKEQKAAAIVQHAVLNDVNAQRLTDKQTALNTLLSFYRSNPTATLTEAGKVIERSKGTVSNYLNELEQIGLIHRNGEGVEVIR